jgi:hypothetical protein
LDIVKVYEDNQKDIENKKEIIRQKYIEYKEYDLFYNTYKNIYDKYVNINNVYESLKNKYNDKVTIKALKSYLDIICSKRLDGIRLRKYSTRSKINRSNKIKDFIYFEIYTVFHKETDVLGPSRELKSIIKIVPQDNMIYVGDSDNLEREAIKFNKDNKMTLMKIIKLINENIGFKVFEERTYEDIMRFSIKSHLRRIYLESDSHFEDAVYGLDIDKDMPYKKASMIKWKEIRGKVYQEMLLVQKEKNKLLRENNKLYNFYNLLKIKEVDGSILDSPMSKYSMFGFLNCISNIYPESNIILSERYSKVNYVFRSSNSKYNITFMFEEFDIYDVIDKRCFSYFINRTRGGHLYLDNRKRMKLTLRKFIEFINEYCIDDKDSLIDVESFSTRQNINGLYTKMRIMGVV